MYFRAKIVLFLLFISLVQIKAQDQIVIDSLKLNLENNKTDTTSIQILLAIGKQYKGNDYVKSLEYVLQANEIAKKSSFLRYKALTEREVGNLNLVIGNYKEAVIGYFNALGHYETLGDIEGALAMHNNLGVVYDRIQNYDKALEEYFNAVELFNSLNSESGFDPLPSLYNNIANIYQTRSDTTSALQYYQKTIELGEKSNNFRILGIAYSNLGKLYFTDLNSPKLALNYLNKGLEARNKVGDKSEIARSLLRLGTYFLSQRDYNEAKKYTNEAIVMSTEIGFIETLVDAYKCLSEIEKELENFELSLTAYELYKANSDSLKSKQASNELTRLQLQYDFDKANSIREAETKRVKSKYYLIIAALSIGFAFALLIAIIVKSRAKQSELIRNNLVQDVEIKNKELTTNVMYLIRKNELINDVAERLLKIQPNVLPENNKVVNSIILDLQREADNDTWKEFELRFNQVHTEFYSNLRELYPDLSPAEEKLCAFLRLNMSSKEIAAITQQSVKSVEVARARLRKKLNLTNTTSNLVTHLASI